MVTMVVGTALDDNSVRKVSGDIERRFDRLGKNLGGDFMTQFADGAASNAPKVQKAMDKAADAVGNLRKEEAKLQQLQSQGNVTRDRLIAQSERVATATRSQTRAMNDAVRQYEDAAQSSGRLTVASGLLRGAISGTQFGQYAGQIESLAGSLGKTGIAAAGTAAGFAVGAKALYDWGSQWDSVSDSIYMTTGKIDGELAGIIDSVRRVASDTAAPIETIGAIGGQVVQSLKLAGPQLDAMTQRLAILDQAGNGVGARDLAKAYNVFGIEAGDQVATLDKLFNVSRDTGIPMAELVQTLNNAGRATKQFNLDAGQTAGLIASFESAGLSGDKATQALTIALKNFSKAGKDAGPALAETVRQIQDLTDAGRDSDAAMLASATFGGKTYLDMLNAIKDHRIDVDQLSNSFQTNGDTIVQAADKTADLTEEWQKFKNNIKSEAEPAAAGFFDMLNESLGRVLKQSQELRDVQKDLQDQWDKQFAHNQGGDLNAQRARHGLPGVDPTGGLLPGAPAGDPALSGLPAGQPLPRYTGARVGTTTGVFGEPNTPFWSYPKKAGDKPVIDPSRYSLDSVPIGGFGADLPGMSGGPTGAPTRGPVTMGPDGKPGYFEHDPQKVFDAESSLISQRQSVENARQKLLEMEADNTSTQGDINSQRVAVQLAERSYISQQQKLVEAQQGTWKKMENTAKKFQDGMDDIGAALDNDFGLSDGLPGLAENLVKFIGNLAAAPLLGPLSAIKTAAGDEGSGIMGMLASNGAFGPRFMPDKSGQTGYYGGASPSNMGPAALLPPGVMPSILEDTGRTPSGPQSRQAAALIQQLWGNQIRGKIGGSRDNNTAKGTHDTGTSIDIPIGPDQGALGDQINAWLQAHAQELGLKYSIWRDRGQYPGGGGFNQPGHQNHIDAHFDGAAMPFTSNSVSANTTGGNFSNFGAPGSQQAVANMIYQQAIGRGYNAHEAQSIVAYAIGESSLDPGRSGGVQGDAEVMGLFQEKPAFARGGGIDPSQRSDPVANTTAYLNQLERNRHLPIEQALPATSVGGPLASGPGAQPQDWGNLMQQAAGYLGQPVTTGGGWSGGGAPTTTGGGWGGGSPVAGSPGQGFPLPWNLGAGPGGTPGLAGGPGWLGGPAVPGVGSAMGQGGQFSQPGVGGAVGSSLIPGQAPGAVPGAGGGMSNAIGGLPLAALQTAASGLDMIAPGAGAAANLGIQLANRSIGFLGQQAGNAVSGIFETLSLSGSKGPVDPLKTIPGRLLAGLAGARPSIPNTAAGGVQQPQQQGGGDPSKIGGAARDGGPMVNIENVHQAPGQEPTSVANEVASQFRSAELGSGAFRR